MSSVASIKYVLFVCTHNAGRSQMAQALFERHAPPDLRAESAGQEPRRAAGRTLQETRVIRDAVEVRVKDLLERRMDLIRSDRTAHQLRLARLLPMPVQEFAGVRSDAEVRLCADAVLRQFDDVPVRSHVMTIAHRRTRECLRRETCDMLAVA